MSYAGHKRRIAGYVKALRGVASDYATSAANVVMFVIDDLIDGEVFRFADFPELTAKVSSMQQTLFSQLYRVYTEGITSEWEAANVDVDALVRLQTQGLSVPKALATQWYRHNTASSFLMSTRDGMRLSERVWKLTDAYKTEIQCCVSAAIKKGMSAIELSRKLNKYLQHPKMMQRDYEESFGEKPKFEHTSYESMRMARTEINTAYKKAEQERWSGMDWVIGYEVKLSDSHPKYDICDVLQGKYPKTFVHTPWHPNCLCMCLPITMDREDFAKYLNGEEVEPKGEVKDVPDNFKVWVKNHKEWINQHPKTRPFFVRDNWGYVKEAAKL